MAVVCLLFGLLPGGGETGAARAPSRPDARPNIVLILTDDMRADEAEELPRLKAMMHDKGTSFENAFVTNALCCPSRTSTLTGRYSGNHGVLTNVPPTGGYARFRGLGLDSSSVATRLQAAGYRTGFFGRYLNGYDGRSSPPGWDRFRYINGSSPTTIENGRRHTYPPGTFADDALAVGAQRFVRSNAGRPMFLAIWARSPHYPYEPPGRYAGLYDGWQPTLAPSFAEADPSDKPAWVREHPPLTEEARVHMAQQRRSRLEMLAGVEDMLGRVLGELSSSGELERTYVVFTSDNGFHFGEHGLSGKQTPYEESIRVPLIVRGPGVPMGATRGELVLNNDLAPTFAGWARTTLREPVDGRSLAPLLSGIPGARTPWRDAFLIEHQEAAADPSFPGSQIPSYEAIRTRSNLYVEYETGERELYDLGADPYQLENVYGSSDPGLTAELRSRLDALRACAGTSCSAAEDGTTVRAR